MKIINLLRSPGFAVVALVFALIAQFTHTTYVYLLSIGINPDATADGVPFGAAFTAYCFAVAFDLSALYFVLSGKKWGLYISYFFGLGIIWVNVLFGIHKGTDLTLNVSIAVFLAVVIVSFSHAIRSQFIESENKAKEDKQAQTPFKCPACKLSFATARQMWGHITTHRNAGKWTDEHNTIALNISPNLKMVS